MTHDGGVPAHSMFYVQGEIDLDETPRTFLEVGSGLGWVVVPTQTRKLAYGNQS